MRDDDKVKRELFIAIIREGSKVIALNNFKPIIITTTFEKGRKNEGVRKKIL